MNDTTAEKAIHTLPSDGSADYGSDGWIRRSRPTTGRQPVPNNGRAVGGADRVLVRQGRRQTLGTMVGQVNRHPITVFLTTFGFLTAGWWFWW